MTESKRSVRSLIRAHKVSREDVEAGKTILFEGESHLRPRDAYAQVTPDLDTMTIDSREAPVTALLLTEAVEENTLSNDAGAG